MANLGATCQTAFDIVSEHIEQWNLTPPGDYLGDNTSDPFYPPLAPIALVVSPIRQRMEGGDTERQYASYEAEFDSTYQLCKSPSFPSQYG